MTNDKLLPRARAYLSFLLSSVVLPRSSPLSSPKPHRTPSPATSTRPHTRTSSPPPNPRDHVPPQPTTAIHLPILPHPSPRPRARLRYLRSVHQRLQPRFQPQLRILGLGHSAPNLFGDFGGWAVGSGCDRGGSVEVAGYVVVGVWVRVAAVVS